MKTKSMKGQLTLFDMCMLVPTAMPVVKSESEPIAIVPVEDDEVVYMTALDSFGYLNFRVFEHNLM